LWEIGTLVGTLAWPLETSARNQWAVRRGLGLGLEALGLASSSLEGLPMRPHRIPHLGASLGLTLLERNH